jgi:glutamyl-Q tRNA(Asp) synthetase
MLFLYAFLVCLITNYPTARLAGAKVAMLPKPTTPYIGRFAPSPTGPLHAGSLVAALASYLDARAHEGKWLLRIDDADLSRAQAGAAQTICQQLQHYGFVWQGKVSHTQDFRTNHACGLAQLRQQSLIYGCMCSRTTLRDIAPNANGERVYPQTCRALHLTGNQIRAFRFACPAGEVAFKDRWAGSHTQNVLQAVGDFVLWRPERVTGFAGGLYNYQLTIVLDDAAQGVTHVVRGADLLNNTARQCMIYDALALPRPQYLHVPLVMMRESLKLSKQHGATALPLLEKPLPYLERALEHLGFEATGTRDLPGFWEKATALWAKRFVRSLP